MERQEPLGYEGVHPEKKFPMLPNSNNNIIIQCSVKHGGKELEVKFFKWFPLFFLYRTFAKNKSRA